MAYRTKKDIAKIWIGNLYPASEMYREKEGETAGACAVNSKTDVLTTLENRHALRGHMNMMGLDAIRRVKALVRKKLGIEPELVFSQKAGCGMCPCSPGFMIKIAVDNRGYDSKASKIRDLFVKYRCRSLSYYTGEYPNRRCVWGVRDTGLGLFGSVKKGRVKIDAAYHKDTTAKAFKALKEILKEK